MMNQNDKELLEMAKEKLRWYTMEASDEEFDVATVDALVNLVRTLEAGMHVTELRTTELQNAEWENSETVLEQFREVCKLRMEDDAELCREALGKESKKIHVFPVKRLVAIITAACVLVLVAVFGSLGIVNAGENQGFFHWLRRDEKGTKVVTVPSAVGFGDGSATIYERVEDVPVGVRQYLPEMDDFDSLEEFVLQDIQSWDFEISGRISEKFVMKDEEELFVELGVIIYKDALHVTWEQFDAYEFQCNELIGECMQDIFQQEKEDGRTEYLLVFYKENKKYFVSGNCGLDKLKEISEEYIKIILE